MRERRSTDVGSGRLAPGASAATFTSRVLTALAALLVAGLAVLGCSAGSGEPDVAYEYGLERAEVLRVVDGDTLQVMLDGEKQKVRLIGVNCPESVAVDERRNTEEGEDASTFTKSLLHAGDIVWLEADVNDTDQYDRLLRYVWLEEPRGTVDAEMAAGKMLNAMLVYEGYADARRYDEDTRYADILEELERDAVGAGRGVSYMWA